MRLHSIILMFAIVLTLMFVLALMLTQHARAGVPERAYQHQRHAMQAWHNELGLSAPTGTLAAQIHKESSWRPTARSPFAAGLAQFTPDTAADMARWNRSLAPADPDDPRWALRAQAFYMARLKARFPDSSEPWLLALAAYNSGPGWTDRSRAVCRRQACCDPERWAGHVELALDPRHADWAVRENRDYVDQIVTRLGPIYERAGWGRAVDVPEAWSCLLSSR